MRVSEQDGHMRFTAFSNERAADTLRDIANRLENGYVLVSLRYVEDTGNWVVVLQKRRKNDGAMKPSEIKGRG